MLVTASSLSAILAFASLSTINPQPLWRFVFRWPRSTPARPSAQAAKRPAAAPPQRPPRGGGSLWRKLNLWVLFIARVIVFILWVKSLVAYISCYRENEKAQRECRQYIREMNEALRVKLQSQGGSLSNLANANLKRSPGEVGAMTINRRCLNEAENLSWRARWLKYPLIPLRAIARCCHVFGCRRKHDAMTPISPCWPRAADCA